MGCPKGLLDAGKKSWLFCQIDAYRKAGGKYVAVILGYNAEAYKDVLPGPETSALRGSLRIFSLMNPLPEFGPFSSVQAGCRFFLDKGFEKIAFAAVDRPLPPPETWKDLAALKAEMAYPEKNGNAGHPVFLSKEFAKKLLSLPPECTRMDVLRDEMPAADRKTVESDFELTGENINSPEQWKALSERLTMLYALPEIIAVCGEKRSGKTTKALNLVQQIKEAGLKIGGILQPSFGDPVNPNGYDVMDAETGERKILAIKSNRAQNGCKFDFNQSAWEWANERILDARKNADILVVDEIGKMEACGKGHLPALTAPLKNESALAWILCMRKEVADTVRPQLNFSRFSPFI
ncbi:nucleoside-triphosphatase THEP1 [Acetobacter sp. CAG:977]|nr:nucleoside-triphosphatase THEP1 [Acetobacter sp. CAG:977]